MLNKNIMKIAMFIKNEKIQSPNTEAMHAFIFKIEDERIVGVEDTLFYNMEPNYISLWLIARQIKVFYIQNINDRDKEFFQERGVSVKTFEEIDSNHIFRAFIL